MLPGVNNDWSNNDDAVAAGSRGGRNTMCSFYSLFLYAGGVNSGGVVALVVVGEGCGKIGQRRRCDGVSVEVGKG